MSDSKNDGGKGFPKKPAPIIDLKATVVESAKPAVDAAKATAAEAAKASAADAAKSVVSEPAKTVASAAAAATVTATTSAAGSKPADVKPADTKPAATSTATSSVPKSVPTPPPSATKPTVAVAPAKAGGGFFTHMAAGFAGAIMAIAGSQVLDLGLGGNAGPSPDLTRRLTALEQSSAKPAATSADAQKLAAADSRLTKLEEAAQGLANGQVQIAAMAKSMDDKLNGQGAAPAAGEFVTRIGKLEEQLASMAAASSADPRNAGRIQQLAELTGKLREIESALTTRTAQLKTELTQQMDQRFAKAGEQTETARSLLAGRTQSVEQTLKSVTDETTALRSGVDALKADVDARFKTAAKPADIQTAIAPVATKLTQLETNMQSVVKSEQERNATAGNILLSLELANLKRALDRGGKYASELAAVNKLAGGKLDLAVLEKQQEVGVPSLATLGQELASAAHAMLDAEAEPADATFGDRMLSGFKSIVRVRKVDHAPGDKSTEALIARMEAGLKEGRVADVVDLSKTLPPKAAAPAAKWLARIEQRAQIDKALADLDASLKTSLAGGAQPKKGTN